MYTRLSMWGFVIRVPCHFSTARKVAIADCTSTGYIYRLSKQWVRLSWCWPVQSCWLGGYRLGICTLFRLKSTERSRQSRQEGEDNSTCIATNARSAGRWLHPHPMCKKGRGRRNINFSHACYSHEFHLYFHPCRYI